MKSGVRELSPEAIFAENKTHWQLQGVRPANHLLRRLLQYQRWVQARPEWPNQVVGLFTGVQADRSVGLPTRLARRLLNLGEHRKVLAKELMDEAIGGARLDNLVCDGLFTLLATKMKNDFFGLWFHWFLGDVPDRIRGTMPKLGLADGQMQPFCHGYARGLMGWFLECEARASG